MHQNGAVIAEDIRDIIFASVRDRAYTAHIIVEHDGIVAGIKRLDAFLADQGIEAFIPVAEGDAVHAGDCIAYLTGTPKQLALAEENAIGILAKFSGIATAARRAVEIAGPA